MPVTPTVFERAIDQRLYDVLIEVHTLDGNVAEKISEAAALIADGADVNVKAVTTNSAGSPRLQSSGGMRQAPSLTISNNGA